MNYWLFQANPKKYRISDALHECNDNHNWTWDVKQHKTKISEGDKVIIWVSGEDAGVLALATITSTIQELEDRPGDKYAIDKSFTNKMDRVRLRIDKNLVQLNSIISKGEILSNPHTITLKQGIRGTNFESNKTEYDAIHEMIG